MVRAAVGLPDGAEILQAHLDAFEFEPDRGPAGEDQGGDAGGSLGFLESDRQEAQRVAGGRSRRDALGLDGEHALEMQAGEPAPRRLALGHRPVEAARGQGETVLARQPRQILRPQDRVLQVGGDDGEILGVEGSELEKLHHLRSGLPDRTRGKRISRRR